MIDLKNFELNGPVNDFAKKLSYTFCVPDNDSGAFNSEFCSKLEKLIVQAFAQHLKELTPKIKEEMEKNQYMVGHILVPFKEAHKFGVKFYAYKDDEIGGIMGVDDYSFVTEFEDVSLVKVYSKRNEVFYITEESLVAVQENDYKSSVDYEENVAPIIRG